LNGFKKTSNISRQYRDHQDRPVQSAYRDQKHKKVPLEIQVKKANEGCRDLMANQNLVKKVIAVIQA
jgi:hypothetical protein